MNVLYYIDFKHGTLTSFPSLLEHKKIFQWNAISHCILKEIK